MCGHIEKRYGDRANPQSRAGRTALQKRGQAPLNPRFALLKSDFLYQIIHIFAYIVSHKPEDTHETTVSFDVVLLASHSFF